MLKKVDFLVFFLCSRLTLSLHAEVTDLAVFRMGEEDGKIQAKDPATETRESIRNVAVPATNPSIPPVYSDDVPDWFHLKRGESKLSIEFDGAKQQAFILNQPIPTDEDNFGFECWAKWKGPEKRVEENQPYFHSLFCNGNQADGFSVCIKPAEPYWNFHYGGVSEGFKRLNINQVPEKEVWTHIALVCTQGHTTLYINGVAVNEEQWKPHEPTERLVLGAVNQWTYTFNGLIDEARFFKFEPGKFDPETDLNFKK